MEVGIVKNVLILEYMINKKIFINFFMGLFMNFFMEFVLVLNESIGENMI